MSYADRFHGKTVLVTGASSGIGEQLASQLGLAGANVGLMARREQRLQSLAKKLAARTNPLVLAGDIADAGFCEQAIAKLADRFGGIDLVVNNAGISMHSRFVETDLDVFHRLMAVNYFGSLYVARFAAPYLKRSGGSLVFVSSIVGKRGFPTRSGYSASKSAVHALFESLRCEWAGEGVHVGLVAPGYTDTEIRNHALGANGSQSASPAKPVGQVMQPQEVAQAIIKVAALRKRERILTPGGRLMVWLNKLLPSVADRVAARTVN